LIGYGSVVGGIGAQAQVLVNGKPVSGLLEFKPAVDPSGYQTFTVSFENPDAITSIDISLANATPGRALHIKDFLINGVAVTPADAVNASSPGTFDLYVRNIHVDASNHQDWFIGAATDNDVIDGGAGNDVITGGIGDDTINGGDGIDTASFTGNVRDYDIAIANGEIVVHDRIAGRDGSDHLANLEFLRFADGAIDAGDLFASLAGRPGSMLQVLATDGAGKITGQLIRDADGSGDLYTFAIAGGGTLVSNSPVNSAESSERTGPDAAGHLPGFLTSLTGAASDRFAFNHQGPPVGMAEAPGVTPAPAAASDILNGTGRDRFVFSEAARHDMTDDFKAGESIEHGAGRIESTIAADAAHLSVHRVGHDAVIDAGHDASAGPAGVMFPTSDHLLFI
jgi:Ca2+-binding RTX toxin-like protein